MARTLAVEPEVLLLDKPTSALDPKAKAKIAALSISRYIERRADHAPRIAYEVIYLVTGEIIRHKKECSYEKHIESLKESAECLPVSVIRRYYCFFLAFNPP